MRAVRPCITTTHGACVGTLGRFSPNLCINVCESVVSGIFLFKLLRLSAYGVSMYKLQVCCVGIVEDGSGSWGKGVARGICGDEL